MLRLKDCAEKSQGSPKAGEFLLTVSEDVNLPSVSDDEVPYPSEMNFIQPTQAERENEDGGSSSDEDGSSTE